MPPPQVLAFTAPSLALLATEPLRAAIEFCSARVSRPSAVAGDGHPVIVYPGLGAGAMTTAQLRTHLQSCNFTVHDWELGVNTGPDGLFDAWLPTLVERVRNLHALHGRKVSLVGWSLGGIYAREIAKCCPECVRQVITLATPHRAIADANHAGTIFRMLGGSIPELPPDLLQRVAARPPVPVTSIYSESDGLVCWRGCLEQAGRQAENIAVHASHLGMPSHPDVLRIVAERLAQPEGAWRPYRRGRIKASGPTAPARTRQ